MGWKSELKAIIVALLLLAIPLGLNLFSSKSFFTNLNEEKILKEIEKKINEISTPPSLDTLFVKYNFSDSEQEVIRNFVYRSEADENLSLVNTFLILENKFPKEFSGKIVFEKDKWTDNFLFALLLAAFGYFFTRYFESVNNKISTGAQSLINSEKHLSTTLEETLKEWNDSEGNSISADIDKHLEELSTNINEDFKKIIRNYYQAHRGFIGGLYDNYPHNYSSIFDPVKSEFDDLRNGTRSLYIMMDNFDSDKYSNFSINLLDFAKECVNSTSYYDNDRFIQLLESSGSTMIKWLDRVNKANIETRRVHIFDPMNSKKESKKFQEGLEINENARKNYKNYYVGPDIDKFRVWQLTNTRLFFGEYIIFDNQVMIKYDEDFKILELFIGSIVSKFSDSFCIPDPANTIFDAESKRDLLTILELSND